MAAQAEAMSSPGLELANYAHDCPRSISLPEPTGGHVVGTITYHWVDRSRPDGLTPDPHDDRQIMVGLFYPAAEKAEGEPAPYVPELEMLRAGFMTDQRDVPHQIAQQIAVRGCVVTHAFANVPVAATATGFPLVLISPGGNVSRHSHTALAEDLASHGWVVAVISHLHSGWDVFPEGGFVMSSPYWQGSEGASEAELAQLDDELASMLAADAVFTLDRLSGLSAADPSGRLTGRIDTTRVAVVGHSRGGSTVGRACHVEPRFGACVIFDNIGPEPETETGLSQPQLTIRRPWPEDRVGQLDSFLGRNRSEAIDAVIAGTVHMSFTDLPLIDPGRYDASIAPERAHLIVAALTRAFLERHVLGRDAKLPSFPEVTAR
jgi:dienelactone hydrolase